MRPTNNLHANKTVPWYRVGMVWLMIGLPFIVVVASMITVTIAVQNAPQIISRSAVE